MNKHVKFALEMALAPVVIWIAIFIIRYALLYLFLASSWSFSWLELDSELALAHTIVTIFMWIYLFETNYCKKG